MRRDVFQGIAAPPGRAVSLQALPRREQIAPISLFSGARGPVDQVVDFNLVIE